MNKKDIPGEDLSPGMFVVKLTETYYAQHRICVYTTVIIFTLVKIIGSISAEVDKIRPQIVK